MPKIAILIDSTFLIEQKYLQGNNIFIIPLSINFDNASFKEIGNKNILLEEIFTKINKEKVIPKTSQPSTQDFLNIYDEIVSLGYEKIIGFYISSKLSGTYQGAENAKDIYLEENSSIEISNFDSLNAAIGIMPIRDVCEYIKLTDFVDDEYIKNKLEKYAKTSKILLIVDSLEYLALGGRISSSIAAIGNLFGIKPLLKIEGGEILEHSKARSTKQAYKKILEIFEEEIQSDKKSTFLIGVTHVLDEKMAKKMLSNMIKILERNDVKYEEVFLDTLGPVISIHVGPNTIGVAWSKKHD